MRSLLAGLLLALPPAHVHADALNQTRLSVDLMKCTAGGNWYSGPPKTGQTCLVPGRVCQPQSKMMNTSGAALKIRRVTSTFNLGATPAGGTKGPWTHTGQWVLGAIVVHGDAATDASWLTGYKWLHYVSPILPDSGRDVSDFGANWQELPDGDSIVLWTNCYCGGFGYCGPGDGSSPSDWVLSYNPMIIIEWTP